MITCFYSKFTEYAPFKQGRKVYLESGGVGINENFWPKYLPLTLAIFMQKFSHMGFAPFIAKTNDSILQKLQKACFTHF